MRYLSAISTSTDPYKAGAELGEALKVIEPEVVLLFASITHTKNVRDMLVGFDDALDNPRAIVFGSTGEGVYETSRAANYGAAALAIDSGGAVRWSAAVEPRLCDRSAAAAAACTRRALEGLGGVADFCMVVADSATADGRGIALGVRSVVDLPIIGGLAGDDLKSLRCRVFFRGAEHEDAVAVLLGRGRIPYAVNVASGWRAVGDAGLVEESSGNSVARIAGMSPRDFFIEQIGKTPGEIDLYYVPLAAYQQGCEGPFCLRAIKGFDEATGHITLFGNVPVGTSVRFCMATRDEVLRGVAQAVAGLPGTSRGFAPKAAVVVSCSGRKLLLEDQGNREIDVLFGSLGAKLPMVGFPSFGEIGPYRTPEGGYSESLFHNETFVLCLFGE